MKKLQILVIVIIISAFSTSVKAKALGNFKSYTQVTDKEVLINSTNGAQIMITAYDNYALGVTIVNKEKEVRVTLPTKIDFRSDLSGSIYVEEIDELMQITTTVENGIYVEIQKKPLSFKVIDKKSKEVLLSNFVGVNFGKNSTDIQFTPQEDELLELLANSKVDITSTPLTKGTIYNCNDFNKILYPNNEICLTSSKGYSLIFEQDGQHEINYSKSEKMKISTVGKSNNIEYILIYGDHQNELINHYAFNLTEEENQISLN